MVQMLVEEEKRKGEKRKGSKRRRPEQKKRKENLDAGWRREKERRETAPPRRKEKERKPKKKKRNESWGKSEELKKNISVHHSNRTGPQTEPGRSKLKNEPNRVLLYSTVEILRSYSTFLSSFRLLYNFYDRELSGSNLLSGQIHSAVGNLTNLLKLDLTRTVSMVTFHHFWNHSSTQCWVIFLEK